MLSWNSFKAACVVCASLATAGCLTSEEPLLDDSNSYSVKFNSGAYLGCYIEDGEIDDDCQHYTLERLSKKQYRLSENYPQNEVDGLPLTVRFLRIAHRSYAIQTVGDEDPGIIYFYGKGTSRRFVVSAMICDDLSDEMITRLVANGDMEDVGERNTDDKGVDVCNLKTVNGLKEVALAYHRGEIELSEDSAPLVFVPEK